MLPSLFARRPARHAVAAGHAGAGAFAKPDTTTYYKYNKRKTISFGYSLDSAAAYCLNFLPSRLVPLGPLTDNMLLKTDKSMMMMVVA